jgi:hypothetical protein
MNSIMACNLLPKDGSSIGIPTPQPENTVSQNVHSLASPVDCRSTRSCSLTGALALGIGLAVPTTGHAIIAVIPACNPLPFTVSNGSCTLDVNGGGVDFQVNASPTSGTLQQINPTLQFLVTNGAKWLLQLSPGDHVGAAIFAANDIDSVGRVYGPGFWDQTGETGFGGFRISNGPGSVNYGWVELKRGSLTVGSFGYQTTANADARPAIASGPNWRIV